MALTAGARIGSYEVIGLLGAGGMGEVYRAHDARLGRDAAIKILPDAFSHDSSRLARFEREARTLASLNHPNIAQIYGVEDTSAGRALVMELVAGEDLSKQIDRGAVAITDALHIARQIASALEAAHEQGIVHRDLKPANIKIKPDGVVKVLDFGLARSADPTGTTSAPLSNSPTMTSPATELGMILGTAAYMAPEQARGKVVDRRADVWAFGVVLYEMLTGRRAFQGAEVSDVLASILKDTLPVDRLPPDTPRSIRRLLRRCLAKDRAERLDSMATARLEIAEALGGGEDALAPAAGESPTRRRGRTIAVVVAAALAGAALTAALMLTRRASPPAPRATSFALLPFGGPAIGINVNQPDLAISPDGRHIVYGNALDAASTLHVRSLDGGPDVALQALGDLPRSPFFSHDGKWLAYFAGASAGYDSRLMKIEPSGGAATEITKFSGNLRGASWGDDNQIVFAAAGPESGLLRVPAAGGTAEVLTMPATADGEVDHLWPAVLPGARHVVFTISRRAAPNSPAVYDLALLDLQTRKWRVLRPGASYPKYLPTGHLVFVSEAGLSAARFDLASLEIQGEPVVLIADVVYKPSSGGADVAISDTGTLVYIRGTAPVTGLLTWFRRDGQMQPIAAPPHRYSTIRLSPDGARAAVIIDDSGSPELLVYEFARETMTPIPTGEIIASAPIWSENGRELFVHGSPGGASGSGIYRIPAAGTTAPQLVMPETNGRLEPVSVVPGGRAILVARFVDAGSQQLSTLSLDTPPVLKPVLDITGRFSTSDLSPDGRWLAYSSTDKNSRAIFLRPYPDVGADRIQISTAGARLPRWSDSRHLFFQEEEDSNLYAVEIDAGGRVSKPTPVVKTTTRFFPAWDVSPDGLRFLRVREPALGETDSELRVVLNWFELVKEKVGAGR